MSYIFEALKKSEEERRRNTMRPPSFSPPPSHTQDTTFRRRLPTILVVAALLGTAATTLIATSYYLRRPSKSAPPQAVDGIAPSGGQQQTRQKTVTKDTDSSLAIPHLFPETKKVVITQDAPLKNSDIVQPAPLTEEAESLPEMAVDHFPDVPYPDELSPLVQQAIPELRLAGHVYSAKPGLRMILINNAIVRENDVVAKNLVLEEIIPQGVILRIGDTRFRLDTQ